MYGFEMLVFGKHENVCVLDLSAHNSLTHSVYSGIWYCLVVITFL